MRSWICLLFFCTVACESTLPVKEQVIGNCVKEADCGAMQKVCKSNQCAPCTAHTDCASLVCDTYGDVGSPGTCVLPSSILYVDSTDGDSGNCTQGTGALSTPFCSIAQALPKVTPGKVVRLLPSPTGYLLPTLDPSATQLIFIGPASTMAGKAATLGIDGRDGAPLLGSGINLVLDGLVLSAEGLIATGSSKVALRRSSIHYLPLGASFEGGTVTLDRVLFAESRAGFSFKSATVNVTNSVMSGNTPEAGKPLIEFDGGSGSFQFNTVAYNVGGATSPMLSCKGGASVTVKNSIFVQNAEQQQILGCKTVANSNVLGASNTAPDQIKADPVFEDPLAFDLRLKPQNPVNLQSLIDKALEVSAADKNVDHDYFGTPRPQGSGYDIGAVEVMP